MRCYDKNSLYVFLYNNILLILMGQTHPDNDSTANPSRDLLPKQNEAVDNTLKFNTQENFFSKIYSSTDHLQRFYHVKALQHYAEVITNKFQEEKRPLAIVDLCCGYGLPTKTLYEQLIKNGVEVEQMIGYDISGELIDIAEQNNHFQPKVQFYKKNVESEFNDLERFDFAICLFGLHWMNNLEAAITAIHRSLKKGGILLSLTPLGYPDLLVLRNKFIKDSKWSVAISEQARNLHKHRSNYDDYCIPMSQYFNPQFLENKEIKFTYTREEFSKFLQSWMEQVRYLTRDLRHEVMKETIAKAYVSDLIDSMQKNVEGNATIKDDGTVILSHKTVDFNGEKC